MKQYSSPQITKIQLRPEQAVLSACSLSTSLAEAGLTGFCRFYPNYPDSSCKGVSPLAGPCTDPPPFNCEEEAGRPS